MDIQLSNSSWLDDIPYIIEPNQAKSNHVTPIRNEEVYYSNQSQQLTCTPPVYSVETNFNFNQEIMDTYEQSSDSRSTQLPVKRRQTAHTKAEQRRRDSIKTAYTNLSSILPVNSNNDSKPISKAAILQNAIRYVKDLEQQKEIKAAAIQKLKIELASLRELRKNYHQTITSKAVEKVSEDQKFFFVSC
ncbi:DgyrCDS8613 [Dimorphilus gyrociliatus]|uniref:DgyrCDS8613 n=1 Tax=Dimorphilus gyrociliatus TaxID=2664684 RepID=A0A7I8VUX3_9ANNE|nr:DgyrCDS8613 [Dimorphilus gyrociliatus]